MCQNKTLCENKRTHHTGIYEHFAAYLFKVSHVVHYFYTYTTRRMQYVCTCFCTAFYDTLSMEKQMSCAICYRTSVFVH